MFTYFPFRYCKDYVCACCLNEQEQIDKLINIELRRNFHHGKIILLGNTGAGKSTFLKQIRLKYGRGFGIEERHRLIPVIHRQIIDIIQSICRAMQKFCIPFENTENEANLRLLLKTNDDYISKFPCEIVDAIRHLWSDAGVQKCYDRRRKYSFLESLDRISVNDYIPIDDDLLRVRIPTRGILEENFELSHYRIQIVDVSGQKSERRKWIYCFDNVTTVIFLASLIGYDQYNLNDPLKQNLMEESLALFHVILSCDYLAHASIILFLNKIDLLAECLASKPLRLVYPDFTGDDNDVEAAKEFIKNKYLNVMPNSVNLKRIYPHFTCSVDQENIDMIFNAIKDRLFSDIRHRISYSSNSSPVINQ